MRRWLNRGLSLCGLICHTRRFRRRFSNTTHTHNRQTDPYKHTNACAPARAHTHTRTHMHTHAHTHMHTHAHTHTHTHNTNAGGTQKACQDTSCVLPISCAGIMCASQLVCVRACVVRSAQVCVCVCVCVFMCVCVDLSARHRACCPFLQQ